MPTVDGSRTIAGLKRLRAGIAHAAELTLKTAVEATEQHAKSTTLWKDVTGGTRASIKATIAPQRGQVIARGVSILLENGTRAHTITARNARMLRFYQNGQVVYRYSVHHPGTKATHFMREARDHGIMAAEFASEFYFHEAIARA